MNLHTFFVTRPPLPIPSLVSAEGVVRIDRSNASFSHVYPGDMPLPDRPVRLLKSIGHSGKFFVPLVSRLHGNLKYMGGSDMSSDHMKYFLFRLFSFPRIDELYH